MNDVFAGAQASEVFAAATLTGYAVVGMHYAWPKARAWVLLVAAVLAGQVASLLIMLMQNELLTVQHAAGHVIVGILATATATGLRSATTNGFVRQARESGYAAGITEGRSAERAERKID